MTQDDSPRSKFLKIFDMSIGRNGAKDLRDWLISSDFFTAPASTKYHGACQEGLCIHSLDVWDQFNRLSAAYPDISVSAETKAIITLLHDVCKIGLYKTDYRNVKNASGVWEKVPCYIVGEDFPYGNHGGKSVFLVSKFLRLTDEEAVSIQCHMGNEDGNYTVSEPYKRFPAAWLLHVADEAATYIDNK